MSGEMNLSLRLTADNSGYVPPVRQSREETEKLANALKNSAPATRELTDAMTGSYKAGALLGTGLVVLGTALVAAAAYAGNMVRSFISMNAELSNLSEQSGLSVEALSALRDVAALTGTRFDVVTTSGTALARSMSKGVEAFDTLGISIKNSDLTLRSQDEVMLDVARSFARMDDGATKTALAQQIFGRSGAQLIPVLNELGRQGEYNVTVTARQAQLADEFNKALSRLGRSSDSLWQSLANAATPALTALAKGFVDALNSTDGLRAKLTQLVNDGSIAVWAQRAVIVVGELIDATIDVGNVLGALWDSVKLGSGVFSAFGTILGGIDKIMRGRFADGIGDLKKGWTELQSIGTGLNAVWSNVEPSHTYRDAIISQVIAIQANTEATSRNVTATDGKGKADKVAKERVADYRDEIARLNEQLLATNASYDGATAKLSNYTKAQLQIQKDIDAGKKVIEDQKDAFLASAKALDDAEAAAKDYAAQMKLNRKQAEDELLVWETGAAALRKTAEAFKQLKEAAEERNATLRADIALIGMTNEQAVIYTAELERQALKTKDLSTDQREFLAGQITVTEQLKLQKLGVEETYRAWQAAISTVSNAAYQFILDVVEKDWKAAFKNLWKSFVSMALQAFAQVSAQKIALSVVGSFAAGGAAASGGGGSSTTPGGGILDSLMSAGSSLAGTFSSLGGAASTFMSVLGTGAPIGQAFSSALAASTLSLGSLVPVVGGIIAAGTLLYNFLDSKRGGPKSGGFASSGSATGISGTDDSGRWFTPNQDDAKIQSFVDGLQTTFDSFLGALGIKFDAVFALGYDTDPAGKAPNRLHAGVFGAAGQIYDQQMSDLGRDPEQLDAALKSAAKASLLVAFQAAGVPEAITDYLNSIPFEGFEAALNDIGAALTALDNIDTKAIFGEIINFDDLAELRQQGETFSQTLSRLSSVFVSTNNVALALGRDATTAFGDVGLASLAARENLIELCGGIDALTSATNFYVENFYGDSRKLEMANNSLSSAFSDLQSQFPDLLTSIPQTREQFVTLVDSLDLSTESGRRAFAALMNIAPTFDYVVDATDAYAQEMKRIADQLRSDTEALGSLQIQLGGGGSNEVTTYQRNAAIDRFASGREWASGTLQSGGYDAFAQLLSGITKEDFANYSAADRQTILDILGYQNQLSSGSSGGSGGSYSSGGGTSSYASADPYNASADAAAKAEAELAAATLALYDALARDPRAEAMQALANSQLTQLESVQRLGLELQELSHSYDGSAEKASQLAKATNEYVDAQVALLLQIESLKTSLAGMFESSKQSIIWSQLSDEERRAKLLSEQADAMRELATATDPAKIAELSKLINDDLVKSFNLLSPEEQKKQQDEYIKLLDAAGELTQKRLDLAQAAVEEAASSAQAILDGIASSTDKQAQAADVFAQAVAANTEAAAVIAKAADTNAATAATLQAVATTMQTAANTPLTIVVQETVNP